MVVQRTPPPVRRSPRKGSSQPPEAPLSSQSSQRIGKIVSSTPSTLSRAVPSTPVPHNGASDFPSLDQMAAVSKEQRSVTRPTTNRAAFAASFPATASNHVPSSLPRPTAQVRSIQTEQESDENQRSRAARSSLTNGAIQRVRQLAGDETPLGVSQARAARQAHAASSSKADASLLADDSGDSTAQLVPGRRDAALNPLLANIDVENPQMPSLAPPAASAAPSAANAAPQAADDAAAADSSTASQASIFGTANRRNGRDQPIGAGAAAAGVAYDFSKYLDGELDPFNRASRANPRRESRPLSAQPPGDDGEGAAGADTSGDTTARGGLTAPSATVPATAPIESTPLFSRVKAAAAAATPRMSPHASPSVSSRKLAHLSSLANGHSTPTAATTASSVTAADASTAAYSRFDPSARTDRIQTMELGELRKKATALSRDLAATQEALSAAKEESEGWASECTGLQEQIATLKAASQRESRARTELSVRLSQYKIEADDRAWKLLSQRRQACLIDVALQHAKNEATYHEGRYHATESELEGEKDELRIRLMLEKKRADLLAMHVKVALRDGARLKKRLGAKSAAVLELQAENQSLAEQLEDAQHTRGSTKHARDDGEMAALRQQLEEAQAEIETLNERDAMMAETRKTWKAERKELLAQVEQLSSSSSAPAPVAKTVEAMRPLKTIKSVVSASQMLPPSSPVYAKKKRPMQGASELEPPSEDEEADRRAVMAATAVARKPIASKTNAPLVPFAQLSTKAAAATKKIVKPAAKPAVAAAAPTKKSSKNWRDEVAITDSDESDSDSDSATKRPSKSSKSKSTAAKKSSLKSAVSSSTAGRKTKPSMPIEYDDQTADPSATPIIRSHKRIAQQDSDDDDDAGPLDSSVLAKFGRDRTNLATSSLATKKLAGLKASAVGKTADAGVGKKKKRKLLGGGNAAMQWSDAGGLAPNFDIPLELSPIKGGAKAAGGGTGAAAFMAGFGMPARNPFA
ncbi:hypothetical protein PHSY_004094 [Pseudozyma hubeiensis SY62]|uniref:Uncharacterized protein n=1 Tax=Pseudozyma hubeiensis (strain SY62) TaxID=1305764 RepID=R9P5C1_PSEHS|nr:hypothetical protein PHSY_004094 [Pseudozyma hubeiensis SY62]GAC96514.1 hypothetical protein PHSY_004094 [Pseudozyma hubeiensis SY62]